MSKVAKHDDDQAADHDGYTSTDVTEGTMKNNSKAWTASRPTKPDWNEAATELKLNSNIIMRPTQDLLLMQDKTTTKSGYKTNTALVLGMVQP